MRVLVSNKSAAFDFEVIDKLEAGLVLEGWEVKSIKNARANLKGSFIISTANAGLVIRGMHISDWIGEVHSEAVKLRERTLLVHKHQVTKLSALAKQPGYSLIPLQLFQNDKGMIKAEIALVKGKRKFDKKQAIKDRDLARELRNSW